jgi:Ala-tRNA(Pro) deacylase
MLAIHQSIEQGDVVTVSSRRVGEPARLGEILEVLGDVERPHYLVRWDDGHDSILYPGESTTITPRREARREVAAPTALLVEVLTREGAEVEVLPHRRTLTAASEARSLGVPPEIVAKTVLARDADGGHVRAVVPASSTLDVSKLEAAASKKSLHVLNEDDLLAAYPQFELGAVPPLGGPAGDTVVVDRSLAGADRVIFEAGVHHASIRMRPDDLIRIAGALVSDIASA